MAEVDEPVVLPRAVLLENGHAALASPAVDPARLKRRRGAEVEEPALGMPAEFIEELLMKRALHELHELALISWVTCIGPGARRDASDRAIADRLERRLRE